MNSLELRIKFEDNELFVEGDLSLDAGVCDIEFSINKLLELDSLSSNGEKIGCDKEETQLPFQSTSYLYKCSSVETKNNIEMCYHGKIDGWLNFILEDVKALSMYSAWYPTIMNVSIDNVKIKIQNLSDHIVLKAKYNNDTLEWEYGDGVHEAYNLIAFKKDSYKVVSTDSINVYYLLEEETKTVKKVSKSISGILEFFNGELFEPRKLNVCDIVSFSNMTENDGGYKRKDLVVASGLDDDENDLKYFLGHEFAHEWCIGADCGTYHDWLNETTAEWAVFLYFILCDNNEEFVTKSLDYHRKVAENAPPIKTADGSRPAEGVHSNGTLLFNEVYKKFGSNAIIEMLRIFVGLNDKTTDRYISDVREYNDKIARMIEKGLVGKEAN